jgi:tetratricopeptide (TPR) repeat protein
MSKLLDNMMARLIKELNSAEYDKAIATADSAIKFDAECVNAYLYKAVAYQKKKMYEESLPILEEGVKYAKQKQIKAAFIKGMITAYDKIGGDECKAKLAELYLSQLYQEIEYSFNTEKKVARRRMSVALNAVTFIRS